MRFIFARILRAALSIIATVATVGLLAVSLVSIPVAQASSSCPNELFRTGPGANLPDCRAYELVSPAEKNGGEVDGGGQFEVVPAPQQAAVNGEAITYGSQTAFPGADPASSPLTTQYISRRTVTGWRTEAITPEQDLPGGVFDKNFGSEEFNPFLGFSENLEHAFLVANEPSPVPGAPAGYYNPYLRDDAANSYRLLSTVTPPMVPPGPADGNKPGLVIEYAGMSKDGSHAVFQADDALTPGGLPGTTEREALPIRNLYEWSEGHLELISVLPADEGGTAVNARFGTVRSATNVDLDEDGNRVVSADGSRVIWTPFTERNGPPQLYMHELTADGPRTVKISASHRTIEDPAGPRVANYWAASADGSSVFFTSCGKLTNDSTASVRNCSSTPGEPSPEGEGITPEGEDLYRYDANTGELSDLSVDPVPGQTASVMGVMGASEDGSYVYFVAQGALAKGAPFGKHIYNIYSWHDGAISLVASTTRSDYLLGTDGNGEGFGRFEALRDSQELLAYAPARVSPNGRYLAFQSSERLTGYDNQPVQAGACATVNSFFGAGNGYANEGLGTGRCVEVYEYDAASGRLTCASCNPEGLPPVGDSIVPMPLHTIAELPGWQSTTDQQRYLLDDGRLFFDSTDELLPQASNGGEMNVYEYEAGGVGSCQRESGCLALISTGTSSGNSLFIDASASGDDVFMVTRQSLVEQDGDEALDLYDVRVDGGFLAPPTPPCGGEACRAPITSAPAIYQAPPSATFVGPGNPPPPTVPVPVSKAKKSKPKSKAKRTRPVKSRRRHSGKAKKASHGSRARRSSRGSRG